VGQQLLLLLLGCMLLLLGCMLLLPAEAGMALTGQCLGGDWRN
jgi:hypothetical protein